MSWNFYPWTSGRIVARDGEYCVVKTSMGHLCGYVTMKKEDVAKEWWGNYDADGLQYLAVHGGLTYASEHDDAVVFGFDCAHAGDERRPELRDPQHVLALAKQMGDQLRRYAAVITEWRQATPTRRAEMLDAIRATAGITEELGFMALIDMLAGCPALKTKRLDTEEPR
jgi:hypothetical protein